MNKAVATAWLKDGVMVNAFARPPCTPEQWRKKDHDGYWSGKGYSEAPLYLSNADGVGVPGHQTFSLHTPMDGKKAAEQ